MRIGVDVGGSHIGIGIIDNNNNLLTKEEMDYTAKETDMSNIVTETIEKLIKIVLERLNITIEEIEQIGIAFPGTVSCGKVIKAENLGIFNLEINKKLHKKIQTKIVLENDAKCAAVAEKEIGSLKEYDDALFLIIGTGVGGAVFIDGKLLRPKRFSGFEVGHMVIKDGLDICNCGRKGCFEVYGSIKRFKDKVRNEFDLDKNIDGKAFVEFMKNNCSNDKLKAVIDNYIKDLEVGLANLINIFEPQAICIGGSFGFYDEILLPKLKQKMKKSRELYNNQNVPEIMIAELKNDAGIIGAAMI